MSKTKIFAIAIVGGLFLSGCQNHQNLIRDSQITTANLEIIAQESQKALIAQQSLKTAQAESLKQLQAKQLRFNTDIINADFIGTPETLLESIAHTYGYRYLEAGSSKTLPIINFTKRKATGFELVKDVAVFVDSYADVTVDHLNKTIILTYK